MVVVDEGVGNDDVLATGGSEDDDFGNVVGSEGFNAAAMVSIKYMYVC